jgi:hypothetical protein
LELGVRGLDFGVVAEAGLHHVFHEPAEEAGELGAVGGFPRVDDVGDVFLTDLQHSLVDVAAFRRDADQRDARVVGVGLRHHQRVLFELAHLAAHGGGVHVDEFAEIAEPNRALLVDATEERVPGL